MPALHAVSGVLLTLALLLAGPLSAQEGPKTIPGVFKGEYWDEDWKVLQVSSDGTQVAFEQYLKYHILLLKEGRFVTLAPKWNGRLSPDHNVLYTNLPAIDAAMSDHNGHSFAPDPNPKTWASVLTKFSDDKDFKVFRDTNFIVGINEQNQLLVSTAFTFEGFNSRLRGLEGLRLVDPVTYRVLQILRRDTLFYNEPNSFYLPRMWFNSTYTAFLRTNESVSGKILAYPFNSDSVVKTGASTSVRDHSMADEHYVYEVSRDALFVFSLHTGANLYKAEFKAGIAAPPYVYRRCLYAQGGNGRLFRFDRETSAVYEEEVTPSGLRTLKTYPVQIDAANRLAPDQWYNMAVAAGPTLVIIPRMRVDGGSPNNRGYVLDLPSGKVSLVIAPFWNPDEAQLADEARVARENAIYYAKQKADKEEACAKNMAGLGLAIGNTVSASYDEGILRGYDCAKDVYTIWIPTEKRQLASVATKEVYGFSFRQDWKKSARQFKTCSACDGQGRVVREVEHKRTREVALGYFSGIETKVTRTWTETFSAVCDKCNGEGVVR